MDQKPWLQNYDDGVPQTLDYPEIPLFHLLEESARKYPDSTCTIFKGARISYREMNAISDRLAAGLAEIGVKKGDRVGIYMLNSPQFIMAYFAVLKLGGVVVAINPLYSAREVSHQLNDAGIEAVIVLSNYYSTVKKVQPKTGIKKVIVTNIKETLPPILAFLFGLLKEKKEGFRVELAEGDYWMKELIETHKPEERPQVEVGPEDIAIFQYSGGTTGIPKGAIGTHRNLVANALEIKSWVPDVRMGKEVVMMALPLFHVYGMVAGMCFAIASAASMVMIPDPRDITDVLESLQKYKATLYPGVPAMYNAINVNPDVISGKYDLTSIRACISGSAPLMLETKQKFESLTGGKLVEGYGLSEAPTASHCNPIKGLNKPGSIGMPLPDIDARIVNLEDETTILPPGEVGELVIKGPLVFRGYHRMPTETENALRDGWLYTGDIARMDEDGYFYIVDRKKELIKPSGYQVWPREVEEVIAEHPKVHEVGVAGVADPYRGETVKAWIVLMPGESASKEEIVDFCRDKMAKFKIPTMVEFRDELPKTMVGKVLRRELVREHEKSLGEQAEEAELEPAL